MRTWLYVDSIVKLLFAIPANLFVIVLFEAHYKELDQIQKRAAYKYLKEHEEEANFEDEDEDDNDEPMHQSMSHYSANIAGGVSARGDTNTSARGPQSTPR